MSKCIKRWHVHVSENFLNETSVDGHCCLWTLWGAARSYTIVKGCRFVPFVFFWKPKLQMVPMDLNIEYWFPKFGFTFLGQIYNFCYLRPFCGEGCGMYFWEVYQRIIHPPMDVLLGNSDQWVMGFTTSLRWRSILERKSGDHATIEPSKEEHPLQNKQQNKIRLSHNH